MIHQIRLSIFVLVAAAIVLPCELLGQEVTMTTAGPGAAELLSNPTKYPAFCYGGYRGTTRDQVPSVAEIKEDLKILSAMGVRLLRTYNTQQFKHAEHLLQAIMELKQADPTFEMYVMLGVWIDCENAWSNKVNHEGENATGNSAEVAAAVALANRFPGHVKVIAVGNEAMVHWASSYFVQPRIILKWVKRLQDLKQQGRIDKDVWITSSDNFAAWGGEGAAYHKEDLVSLIKAVDYISIHTYPFHDTFHQPEYWVKEEDSEELSKKERSRRAVHRALARAKEQYKSVAAYIASHKVKKPIHIGETGWATVSGGNYGASGSGAADEYKSALFYQGMRQWTSAEGISCFFFEAFDEPWKDMGSPSGSENHFGMIDIKGRVKFALWKDFDSGVFHGLTRGGKPLTKSFSGDVKVLEEKMLEVPETPNFDGSLLTEVADNREMGQPVSENIYLIFGDTTMTGTKTRPSAAAKLNAWEGTCGLERKGDQLHVTTGTGVWWGCGIEIRAGGKGENLEQFKDGKLHFEICGDTQSKFTIGFQSGQFADGNQVSSGVLFGPGEKQSLTAEWKSFAVPLSSLVGKSQPNLQDVTSLLYLKGDSNFDGKAIKVRRVFFSK